MKNISKKSKQATALLLALAFGFSAQSATAATALTSQLQVGMSGSQVSNLQSFLASNSSIYPEGLITGYFGEMTRKAVQNFQVAYNLSAVGRVGPQTIAVFNRLVVSGHGLDLSAPQMSAVQVTRNSRQATLSWNTNSSAYAKVFFDTRPFSGMEASRNFEEPVYNASFMALSATLTTGHSVVLQNLIPGTQYYYVAESIDASGNVTVTLQGTFVAI